MNKVSNTTKRNISVVLAGFSLAGLGVAMYLKDKAKKEPYLKDYYNKEASFMGYLTFTGAILSLGYYNASCSTVKN